MQKPSLRYEKNLWRQGCRLVAGIDEAGRGPLAGPVVAAAVVIKLQHSVILSRACKARRKISGDTAKVVYGPRSFTIVQDDAFKKLFQDLAVRDSKLLSSRQREILYQKIIIHSQIDWGIGIVSEKIIDEINILEATKFAMMKAVANLSHKPDWLLIDGNKSMLLSLRGGAERRRGNLEVCGGTKPEIATLARRSAPAREGTPQPLRLRLAMTKKTLRQRTIICGDKKVFSIACASIIAKVTRDKIMTDLHKIYPQYGFSQHKGYGTKLHFAKLAQCGVSPIHRRSFHPVSEFVRI